VEESTDVVKFTQLLSNYFDCYLTGVCQLVCRSVTVVSAAKTAEPIKMPFGLRTRSGYKESCVRWGPDLPWEGAILRGGEGAAHCKVQGHSAVICAKLAEPIEMLFWIRTLLGPRRHVLGGVTLAPPGIYN